MEKFIAIKPARFDRDYAVGEEVPADVIDPNRVKSLIDMGKIQRLVAAVVDEKETSASECAGDSFSENGVNGNSCPLCARNFANKGALASHMRSKHPDFEHNG